MEYKVDVTETRRMTETWVVRGIRSRENAYKCLVEKEVDSPPNVMTIAQFLADNPEVDFCVVDHKYQLRG